MKVQKIKLSSYDYSWLVLDNNHLPVKPIRRRLTVRATRGHIYALN